MYSTVREQGKSAPFDRPLAQFAGSALAHAVWERLLIHGCLWSATFS